jgi:hypothetical protein
MNEFKMKMDHKDEELYTRIDEVLHYIWDPIGVAGEPFARDEYKAYVPKVFSMIKANEESKLILGYLAGISNDNMGLRANIEKCDRVVKILKAYKKRIEERL